MSAIVYLYHSISIDLESSRSCNSTTLQAYSYDPGLLYLLTNQSTISFQSLLELLLLPCSVPNFFEYQTNRTSNIEHRTSNIERRTSNVEHRKSNIEPSIRISPTDERTDQSNQKLGTSK